MVQTSSYATASGTKVNIPFLEQSSKIRPCTAHINKCVDISTDAWNWTSFKKMTYITFDTQKLCGRNYSFES